MSADAPTPFELLRAVEQLRKDMQSGFGGVNTRLDRMVTAELFALYQQAIDRRFQTAEKEIGDLEVEAERKIGELKAAADKDKSDRAADRRWRVGLTITSATAIILFFVSVVVDLSRAAS